MKNLLLSAAIGDICGQPYEFENRTKDYNAVTLLGFDNTYTDDTVCTFACAETLLHKKDMAVTLKSRCKADLFRGYGGKFVQWIIGKDVKPAYNSFGNGSGMRASSAGFLAKTESECIELATETAMPTHNHPEGIKGAVATALAVFFGMKGHDKNYIRTHVLDTFYPEWSSCKYSDIKPDYKYELSCQKTIPPAIISFLESNDYEDCLKLTISLGGDADTLAAIAGPMAYAYYKDMPQSLIDYAKTNVPAWMLQLNDEFDEYCNIHLNTNNYETL